MKTEKVFWEWIPQAIRIEHGENDADAEIIAKFASGALSRWNKRVEKVTGESVLACLSSKTPILLLCQAYNTEGSLAKQTLTDNGLDEIAQRLTDDEVFHLSMKNVFENLDFSDLYSDSSHLRSQGHEVLAKALAKKIVDSRIFENLE